ncbi:SAM-dependent methyltransferase [Streptosporangium sp. KLBMP 9127]|nr:SAM-dependent methyltransferase [Streptosporangium sp. KLBMP 9127]
MYDYALGGKDNYACDREAAEKVFRLAPEMRAMARQNRRFLGRAIRFLSESGIRQFIDVGSGLPARQNVHQVVAPDSRVVYVDHDPIVARHGEALLATSENVAFLQADLREPDRILGDPALRRLIDFSQPVGLLLVAVLHYVPEYDDPAGAVKYLAGRLAPGSHLAVSHLTNEFHPAEVTRVAAYSAAAGAPWVARDRAGVLAFFPGYDLVEPGLVTAPDWRPEIARTVDPTKMWIYAGVGRKP